MRKIIIKNRYKKDYKKALKNRRQDTNKLNDIIEITSPIASKPIITHCNGGMYSLTNGTKFFLILCISKREAWLLFKK